MPPLSNAKHERFVQEIAKGRTQEDAYETAGYKPSRSNASVLRTNKNIQARLAEIQQRAAVRTEITVASISENLARLSGKAELLGDSAGISVARAAQMDIAKLNGLIVDKSLNATAKWEELLERLPSEDAGKPSSTSH